MESDLKRKFEDLVKEYVKDLESGSKTPLTDLDELVDKLYDVVDDHWYSSSRDC